MSVLPRANPLLAFAGEWQGQETIHPSKWGPAGVAQVRVAWHEDLDGKAVIHTYAAERDGKPWLSAHAIFTFDPVDGGCNLFWFDSLGFVPAQPATGHQDGSTLSFVRVSPRGQTRHLYTLGEDGAYTLQLATSFDQGASWVPVMDGRYTRA